MFREPNNNGTNRFRNAKQFLFRPGNSSSSRDFSTPRIFGLSASVLLTRMINRVELLLNVFLIISYWWNRGNVNSRWCCVLFLPPVINGFKNTYVYVYSNVRNTRQSYTNFLDNFGYYVLILFQTFSCDWRAAARALCFGDGRFF